MFRRHALGHTVSTLPLLIIVSANPLTHNGEDRWEEAIQKFEAMDRLSPPPKGATVFIGSSSIRMWKLRKYFPGRKAINRGFGGSQIADSNRYMSRILLPCRPKAIVLYAGDNDIAAGKTPETVHADYKAFVKGVRKELPESSIIFIAIKPSLARWELVEKMRVANRLICAVTRRDDRLHYVDIDKPMIGADGKPRPELFLEDGLHLSDAGYKLWTRLVAKELKKAERSRQSDRKK